MPATTKKTIAAGEGAARGIGEYQKLGSENNSEPQTEITALCRQAESLAILMEAGADNDDPENASIRDTAFERVCAISEELSCHETAEPSDILNKINLWRMLTVEDGLDTERNAPDERLLVSIIDDFERLLQAR